MSYILDAIKKAETQRQIEQVPTLGSAVAFQPNNKPGIARKIIVFLLVVAVIAVPLYLFREPVQTKASEGLELAQSWLDSMMDSEDTAEVADSAELSEQELAAQSMGESLKELELGSEPETVPKPKTESESSDQPQPQSQLQLQAQAESETESETVSKAIASPETIAPEDLAVLKQVTFTVISYSADSNKRFAMDGANVLREGDTVEGFPIIAIRQNTVVVNVRGVLYEIRL